MKKETGYQYAAIIPARYASTRFPGKPLAMIGNKYMVQRVYEQALKSIDNVYIATDDQRISEVARKFGRTLESVFNVKETLDLERQETALHYIEENVPKLEVGEINQKRGRWVAE